MNFKRRLAAFAALILIQAAGARAASGRLEAARGKVTVVRAGAAVPVKTGAPLRAGDELRTGAGAYALVALEDGSRIKLRAQSAVVLADEAKTTDIILKLGGVFARVTARSKGREFRVRTSGAVASVRGTEFFTAFGRTQRAGQDLWLCVNEGAVEVAASGEKLLVKAGEGIIVKSGKDLTKPQAYDWTKTLNWNMDEGRPLEDKTKLDAAYSDLLDQDYR